ncbi:MAG: DUF2125 domain-containing protein [Alphaproteobacteria bacterium]
MIDFVVVSGYIMTMLRPPMRTPLIAAGLLIAVCAGYTIYWYSAAGQIRSGIDRWAENRRAKGWTVELGEFSITGFPFRLDLFFQTPVLAGPGNQWRWEMPNAQASARPWMLTDISMSVPGVHTLKTEKQSVALTLSRADGELKIRSGQPQFLLVRLAGVDWVEPGAIRTRIDILSVRIEDGVSAGPESENGTTGLGIAVDARKVVLPEALKPPLGTGLNRLSIDAVAVGPFEPRGTLSEALARWRDAGGALEVLAFALDWESLSLRGDGTFALDENLQPQGAMTAEIDGVDKTSDALIAAGVIDARTAFAAKVANRALSFGGGPARLPVSIQRQRLYLGPVPLFRLKPVRWN